MKNIFQQNLINKDAILKRKEWVEVAKLLGQPNCKYMYLMDDAKFTIHGEVRGTYSEPQDIPIIWMKIPDQETAHSLGWVAVLSDDKPYIAQIPWDTPNLRPGCRIQIMYAGDSTVDDESNPGVMFRITRVYTMSRYPSCRMVQLAPEVESSLKIGTDGSESKNYSFLNVDQNS